jgi:hypothetical protein
MLIGRDSEVLRLRQVILERRSLLVYGKRGAGKTELLAQTLKSLPAEVRKECIVCAARESLYDLFQELAKMFAVAGDRQILSRVIKETGDPAHHERWILKQTSLRLRGILRQAARDGHYSIFLDSQVRLPDGIYRVLREWTWSRRTPVVILACGSTEHELGRSGRLFWHDELRLQLGPLSADAAGEFLDSCVTEHGLGTIAREDFREFVLKESGCLPGAIRVLCEMATNPAYQSGDYVKLHTLRIDFRLKQSAFAQETLQSINHD